MSGKIRKDGTWRKFNSMKILVRGPLLSQSGYGVHSRQVFSYLLCQKNVEIVTQILPWGITPWCVNTEKEKGIYGEIMSRSRPINEKFDMSFQVQLPNEWDPNLAKFNVGVTAGVETDKCSKDWATVHREKMDLIIVPSSHTKMTFVNSGTGKEKTPIHVVQEYYFDELLEEVDTSQFSFSTSKNFMTIGMFTAEDPKSDRKNVENLIKWFCQEFDGVDDVGLIVKASKGRETTIDREIVRKTLRGVVSASGAKKHPKIYMLHGSMTRKEMASLYKHESILGFCSATRGEGFGLPMLEAAVAGLPVICTNWSSVTEFLDGKSFLAVDYDLTAIPKERVDNSIFISGTRWANPREQSFKKNLRKLYNNYEEIKSIANKKADSLSIAYGKDSTTQAYDKILGNIIRK